MVVFVFNNKMDLEKCLNIKSSIIVGCVNSMSIFRNSNAFLQKKCEEISNYESHLIQKV
jgi:hypothetical protein